MAWVEQNKTSAGTGFKQLAVTQPGSGWKTTADVTMLNLDFSNQDNSGYLALLKGI